MNNFMVLFDVLAIKFWLVSHL